MVEKRLRDFFCFERFLPFARLVFARRGVFLAVDFFAGIGEGDVWLTVIDTTFANGAFILKS